MELGLIDLTNALNSVSWGAVLSAVREHFPLLAPWADTCCRFDSNLLVGNSQIPVSEESSLGPSPSHSPSIHASSKPFASLSPCSLEISITRASNSTTEASQAPAVQLFLSTLKLLLREMVLDIARKRPRWLACFAIQNSSRLRGLHLGIRWQHPTSWSSQRLSGMVRVSPGKTRGQSTSPA